MLVDAILLILIILNTGVFYAVPFADSLQNAWYLACIIATVVIYPLIKQRSGWRFRPIEIYMCLAVVSLIVLPAWAASRAYGQPLIYGLLAQRIVIMLVPWIIGYAFLQQNQHYLPRIEKAIVRGAWLCAFATIVANLFFDASILQGDANNLARVNEEGSTFLVGGYMIAFGAMRYGILAIRTRKLRYYIYSGVLLYLQLGGSGRFTLLACGTTLVVFIFRASSLESFFVTTLKGLTVIACFAGAAALVFPEQVSARFDHFEQAVFVVFSGKETYDPSATARIYEVNFASARIRNHPVIGNGRISHQWNGGQDNVFGEYFYADDIGIIGIVFTIGYAGLVLVVLQYLYAWRAHKKVPLGKRTLFFESCLAFSLYTAISSLETGVCFWLPSNTLLAIALCCFMADMVRVEGAPHLSGPHELAAVCSA